MKTPIHLSSITHGAEYEIDLTCFPEPEPVFAYVDDVGGNVQILNGLIEDGRMVIVDQPDYLWLKGPRNCLLLKASPDCRDGDRAVFRSLGLGEFCLEIYRVLPDQSPELLRRDDFCFK